MTGDELRLAYVTTQFSWTTEVRPTWHREILLFFDVTHSNGCAGRCVIRSVTAARSSMYGSLRAGASIRTALLRRKHSCSPAFLLLSSI